MAMFYKFFSSLVLSIAFISNLCAQSLTERYPLEIQPAWNNPNNNMITDQSKPGYKRLEWSPGSILPIRLRDGMITVLNMPQNDIIADAYVGAESFFNVKKTSPNTLLLQPIAGQAGTDTNLIVIGKSGVKYVFYLRSERVSSPEITDSLVDVISLNTPSNSLNNPALGNSSSNSGGMKSLFSSSSKTMLDGEDYEWIKSIKVDPSQFQYDIDIWIPNPDDYVIAPVRVWRDQIFTYIDFGDKALSMTQRPTVSIIVDGGESVASFHTDGPHSRLIIVEGVGDLILRNGQKIVCLKRRQKHFIQSFGSENYGGSNSAVSANRPINSQNNSQQNINNHTQNIRPLQISNRKTESRTIGSYLPSSSIPVMSSKYKDISIDLGSSDSVKELEERWEDMKTNFNDLLLHYEDRVYFVVDERYVGPLENLKTTNRAYRLRVGPMKDIAEANGICSKLSQFNHIMCNVVQ
ncbi:MAG: TrbG/VirB9 family P-type conjugative transfer protein [Alphaproteobacteria bacterium]|nr:TrbG/VirB9 family P-type conjugative transfer protein [Alphaproteobacteria bacterium]MBL0717905.1 TrbG/VirB9 family P-type conjugative transfer protein [Alphaproteobacteria bacterium]